MKLLVCESLEQADLLNKLILEALECNATRWSDIYFRSGFLSDDYAILYSNEIGSIVGVPPPDGDADIEIAEFDENWQIYEPPIVENDEL